MFFLALFQKSGTKTTKKQFCGGTAGLASLRTNTGTLQASSSKRQPPGGKDTSSKVLHFTLLSLGILDLSVQAPEVFWEFRVKTFFTHSLCRHLGAGTQHTGRSAVWCNISWRSSFNSESRRDIFSFVQIVLCSGKDQLQVGKMLMRFGQRTL